MLWSLPSGLYVLGSRAGDRRNLMTLNWASQVATTPKLVAVSVEAGAVTHGLVQQARIFSLNLLARADRSLVRKFVKPVSDDGDPDRLGGHIASVRAAVAGAPILAQAAAWLDCRVVSEVGYTSHTLFVGEVIDCGEARSPRRSKFCAWRTPE